MPAREGVRPQQQHPAHRLVVERLAEPGRVAEDQPALELHDSVVGDANAGQVSESGIHAVHGVAGVEDPAHRGAPRFHPGAGAGGEHARCSAARGRLERVEPERLAVDDDGVGSGAGRTGTHLASFLSFRGPRHEAPSASATNRHPPGTLPATPPPARPIPDGPESGPRPHHSSRGDA